MYSTIIFAATTVCPAIQAANPMASSSTAAMLPPCACPGGPCENCHNKNRWDEIHFDHSQTGYELQGKHKEQSCRACHFKPLANGGTLQQFKGLTASCTQCHKDEHHNQFATNGKSWKIDRKNISFDHNLTQFPLRGVHQDVNCVTCHPSLVFSEAEPECMSCHTDIHEQTVGFECGRCHTTSSWIVSDIIDIHRHSRFPLLGAHVTADCYDCHKTASLLRFDPLGVECIDCHRDKYLAATSPNHVEGGLLHRLFRMSSDEFIYLDRA